MPRLPLLRTVWADVTKHPQTTVRETAIRTGLCTQTVQAALTQLVQVGYISHGDARGRARRIHVPFAWCDD